MTKALEIFNELTTGYTPLESVTELSSGDTVVFRRKRDEDVYSIATLGARVHERGSNFAQWREAGGTTVLSLDGEQMEIYVVDSQDKVNEAPGTVIEATIINGIEMPVPVRLMYVLTESDGHWTSSEAIHLDGNPAGRYAFTADEIDLWEVVLLP